MDAQLYSLQLYVHGDKMSEMEVGHQLIAACCCSEG